MSLLEALVSEDFGVAYSGKRWMKSLVHSSLVVDKDTETFFWNASPNGLLVGSALDYLTKVRQWNYLVAVDYINKHKNDVPEFSDKPIKETPTVITDESIVYKCYDFGKGDISYWNKRGINSTSIDFFKLGKIVTYHGDYFTIPIYMDGQFRNMQLRRDIPTKDISVMYRNVGGLLFNSDVLSVVDTIYITEGLTDCIRLFQEGVPCVSSTVGAGGWLEDWLSRFNNVNNIYVVYDNDNAGRSGAKRVADRLGLYRTKIYTFPGASEKYDTTDYFNEGHTVNEFTNLVKEQSKYAFELP